MSDHITVSANYELFSYSLIWLLVAMYCSTHIHTQCTYRLEMFTLNTQCLIISCLCYYQFSIFSFIFVRFCCQSSIILKFDRYMYTINQHTVNSISQLDRLFYPSFGIWSLYCTYYTCICV